MAEKAGEEVATAPHPAEVEPQIPEVDVARKAHHPKRNRR
jgi:hypothetical protein